MYFAPLALAFTSLLAGSQVYAIPTHEIAARQVGDLQCNIDRLGIVAALAATQNTLKTLSKDVASDPASAASVKSAEDSISGAQGAIGVIAQALLAGQNAPAEARDQVGGNLTAAHTALSSISSEDSSVSAELKKALAELSLADAAGNGVVKNCK